MRNLEQEYQDAIQELSKCEKQMLSAIYNNDAQQIFPLLDETQNVVTNVLLESTPPDKVLADMLEEILTLRKYLIKVSLKIERDREPEKVVESLLLHASLSFVLNMLYQQQQIIEMKLGISAPKGSLLC